MKTIANSVGVKVALASKLAWLVFLLSIACLGVAGCGASGDETPLEPVATESSPLVSSGPACADGTIEDTFSGGIVGCSGAVTWDKRRRLCGGGYRAATAAEWAANAGGGPTHNYWTDDDLHYNGDGPSACSVSLAGGSSCIAGRPMRVCTSSGTDAEGNSCTWTNCGLDSNLPNRFFGGCNANPTAGTLCIPTACADGTVEETFANGMVGCAGKVKWDNRRALCSAGYRAATAKEWATLGGVAPQHNYWTDDELRWSGQGTGSCTVSSTSGDLCADSSMLVCTSSGSDPEGNDCTWENCGLDSNTPNKFFGGCSSKAGTLCIPEGCADGTVEQTFPNGLVRCAGNASSSSAAAPLCAPGYRLATSGEFNTLSHEEIRQPIIGLPGQRAWTQTGLVCPPGISCGPGATGGGLCVPERGCADGTAEQLMPEGFVGCAGTVTWANRDSLCARGYRTATAKEWSTLNSFAVQITPTHNYWTADNLKYTGPSTSCSVSITSGSLCTTGRPMRLCTATGTDAEGNTCSWSNCGFGTPTPNRYFGGCNANPNAGALCVPDVVNNDHQPNIVTQDPTLVSMLEYALNNYPETPGLAVAVVVNDKIYSAALGKRKATDTTRTLLPTDKFQQNSVSKTIAGTVSTRVVDQGSLSWDSTLGQKIPSIFPAPYPDYQNVTLAELHAHASGFDFDTFTALGWPAMTYYQYCGQSPKPINCDGYPTYPVPERKRLYARDYTLDYPLFPHGTGFRYGGGAVPAISMVEQTLFLTPYDSLLQDFVLRPLMMKNSGTTPDVFGHSICFAQIGGDPTVCNAVNATANITVGAPSAPEVAEGKWKLPVGGHATSAEDIARYARATLYSPRHPVQYWSYRTQQARLNNVGLSNHSPAGWALSIYNAAGGLDLSHTGANGVNFSFINIWPERRVAFAAMANCQQAGGGSNGRALDYIWDQIVNQGKLAEFGAPPPTFPHQDAPSYLATTGTSSSNKPGDEANKAFDGNYDTYWAAADNVQSAWLKVTVPQQAFVGHVLVNENGPFDKEALHPDLGLVVVKARSTEAVVAFRVTSYQLYLIDSSGAEWLAATGTTLGVNKLIPVNGYNVTGARLVMNTQFRGPVIKEMHLLPY